MSKVKFCIEEDNPYSLERLEEVLGKHFWYRNEDLRIALEKFITFPDKENLIALLKLTPHAPVYDKEKLKTLKPNVLLITNEPALNDKVIRNLYLRPARRLISHLKGHIIGISEYRIVLEEIIERFNLSMFSWLTLTHLPELGNKINGDRGLNLKSTDLAYHFKKISYWIPNVDKKTTIDDFNKWKEKIEDWIKNPAKKQIEDWIQKAKPWLEFLYTEREIKVIHWDLLPYAQNSQKEKNDINDEIKEIVEYIKNKDIDVVKTMITQKIVQGNFEDINTEDIKYALKTNESDKLNRRYLYNQSLWYFKLLRKFLDAFNEVNERFFILIVGNRIIKGNDRRKILGHLFEEFYKVKPTIKDSIVIFRDQWCSCNYGVGNLYFVKFDEFLNNNVFDWNNFDKVLNQINNYYGGKNEIPCN